MRVLHTMIRVGDLERSLRFHTLGMKLLGRKGYPDGRFTLAFVGYGPQTEHAVIELTHNWGMEKYDLGNAFGHVAIEVDDAYAACEEIKRRGGRSRHPCLPRHSHVHVQHKSCARLGR